MKQMNMPGIKMQQHIYNTAASQSSKSNIQKHSEEQNSGVIQIIAH